MGSKSLNNTVFWLAAPNDPYLETLPDSLPLRGAKRWPGKFFSLFQANFVGKSGPQMYLERPAIFYCREVGQVSIPMFWHAASPKTMFFSDFDPI